MAEIKFESRYSISDSVIVHATAMFMYGESWDIEFPEGTDRRDDEIDHLWDEMEIESDGNLFHVKYNHLAISSDAITKAVRLLSKDGAT